MNERINELAFQAKLRAAILLHHYGNIDALTDSEQESLKQIEKFAELIVRECDKYVTERWDVCEPWMDPGDLLKHFGVQE